MGKAKRFNSYDDDIREKRRMVQNYGLARQNLSGIGSSFRSSPLSPSGSTVSPSNFLSINGGNMLGPISFNPVLTSISAGAIDISETSDNFSSRVIVSPQSGSTDDLTTINGVKFDGQLLIIQGIQTDTITLKNSGNIETIDGNDFDIEDDDNIMFIYDVTDTKWQQITVGKQGSSGGVSLSGTNTWTGTNTFTATSFSVNSTNIFLGDSGADNIFITGDLEVNGEVEFNDEVRFDDDVILGNTAADQIEINGDLDFQTNTATGTFAGSALIFTGYITIKVGGSNKRLYFGAG